MATGKPPFQFVQRFHDSTGGIINLRIVMAWMENTKQCDLTNVEFDEYLRVLLMLAHKMVSVWKHKEAYKKEQSRLVEEAKIPPQPGKPRPAAFFAEELLRECDGFLVQIKSTLDHLVKIPVPLFGKSVWNMPTFGDKGEKVMKALKRNLPKRYQGIVGAYEKLIFDKHRQWLEDIIKARDKVTHSTEGGLDHGVFMLQVIDGKLVVPMWSDDMTIEQVMEIVWANLIAFVEDFIAVAVKFRLPDTLELVHFDVSRDSMKSPWQVIPTQFITMGTATKT